MGRVTLEEAVMRQGMVSDAAYAGNLRGRLIHVFCG